MAIPQREQRILLQKSGNRCAFPGCRRLLTADSTPMDRDVVLGEMAHIVGESPNGPRGASPLTLDDRNRYDNLILLCNIHHQLIDDQPQTYSVEHLLQMKRDHEEWVQSTLGRGVDELYPIEPPPQVTETVYSTLVGVERMPRYVYGGPCDLRDERAAAQKIRRLEGNEMAPFILHSGMLFAFQNMTASDNVFADIVAPRSCRRYDARDWWTDPEYMQRFIMLLNRALNKLTGRLGLYLDKRHHRYFFHPKSPGEEVTIEYQPLNQNKASRKVVWQAKNKRTGQARGYWYHRAVALRFLQSRPHDWCLSIRPELHVTMDGVQVLPSEEIGARVTRKKSRMFNYDLLGEINFWRYFLSHGKPRIILDFGPGQTILIPTSLLEATVVWPGIPEEHSKPFKNVEYLDDLFSWAEVAALDREEQDTLFEEDDDLDELYEDSDGFED